MADPAGWKVLLIDDEADICEVMAYTLEDAGYQVQMAGNGEAGLARCESDPPQIIVTDVRMPGISGIEVLETVKQRFADIEVVVATAFGDMDLAVRALRLDASDFITKPINADALLVAVARARQRYATRQQLKAYTRSLEEGWSETHKELMETVAYQHKLIESSMDGILGCDAQEQVVTFNQSMEKMLDHDRGDVIHKQPLAFFFEPRAVAEFQQALASTRYGGENRLFLYETSLKSQSGHAIPVQVSATRLFESGQPSGLVCFFRDLREIHRLEREMADQARILHQDKMMSLGRLAASVAHEINNPLSGILNYLRLMIRIMGRGNPDPRQQEKFMGYLQLAEKETGRCAQIVSHLLTFSRKQPVASTRVDVADLLQRCTILSQHKLQLSNIELQLAVDERLPAVIGDVNQLQQCLINLIFNAIDAMPQGGCLTLRAHADGTGQQLILCVEDSGMGIDAADLPHIFEPFFTTKKEGHGVGLGLSTTFGIIEHHKGTIMARSRPGKGTIFRIELPVAEVHHGG